jgi:hypothetical protein
MRFLCFWTLLLCPAVTRATDLAKIDRTIKKEPAYKGRPKYCLLVFGPEAKTRVWLVLDGDTLYVDRNGNGDLTEQGERVAMPAFKKPEEPGAIAAQREAKAGDIHDGRFTHTDLEITQARLAPDWKEHDREGELIRRFFLRSNPDGLLYGVSLSVELRSGQGRVQFVAVADTQGCLCFADSPGAAPVIHFDGPLQMGLQPAQELLRRDKPAELHCCVGTPGLGKGAFATLVYATNAALVPAKCHPVAEVEFSAASAHAKPLRARFTLDHRC